MKDESLEVVKLLRDLISIDTQNPPGNEKKMVEFILSFLNLKPDEYRIHKHNAKRWSLVFDIPGMKHHSTTLLLGHMDTVPASKEQWQCNPFTGIVQDHKVYGLGASDMKGGLAAILCVAKYFKTYGGNVNDLKIALTADEETGSIGIIDLQQKNILADVEEVIVAEPTDGKLAIAEKGVLWIQLLCEGKQAHGAMPHLARNGNEFLWKMIDDLKKQTADMQVSEKLGSISISTTEFHGGFKENIIPKDAKAILDIRTVKRENHQEIKTIIENLRRYYKEKSDVSIKMEIVNEKFPVEMEENAANIVKMKRIIQNKETIGIPYYTDLAELFKEETRKFMIYGPGQIHKMHKENEWIYIDDIEKCIENLRKYIQEQ